MDSPLIYRALEDIYYDNASYDAVEWLEHRDVMSLWQTAIYFHANKCIEKIYNYLINKNMSWHTEFEIAASCDNVWFFQKYQELYYECPTDYRIKILVIAQRNNSHDVVDYLNKIDKVPIISFWNNREATIHSTYYNAMRDIKRSMDTLYETWILQNQGYTSLTQWLPRELLEDQLQSIFYRLHAKF